MSAGGRKSRILMSMSVASELRDHLNSFSEHIHSLGIMNTRMHSNGLFDCITDTLDEHTQNNNQQSAEDGRLRSAFITRDDRKYFLDLKENERGKFLRVCYISSVVV